MKKILLILAILVLTGCYDYKELNEINIVSSILIDYKEDNYVVDVELFNASKEKESPSYFIEGTGKTLEEALNNANSSNTFEPFYGHMNVVVLSYDVASEKLDYLYDYFVRDPIIRRDFQVVLCDEIDKITDFKTAENSSFGETVKNLVDNSEKLNTMFRTMNFSEIINCYLNDKNYFIGNIKLEEKNIILEDTYLISNNKLNQKMDKQAVLFLNLLDNMKANFVYETDVVFKIYDYKVETKVQKDKIAINFNASLKLLNSNDNSIDTVEDIREIEKKLNDSFKKYIGNCIDYSKNLDEDLYGFNYLYYQRYPKLVNKNVWKNLDYEINSNIILNEKGVTLKSLKEGRNE